MNVGEIVLLDACDYRLAKNGKLAKPVHEALVDSFGPPAPNHSEFMVNDSYNWFFDETIVSKPRKDNPHMVDDHIIVGFRAKDMLTLAMFSIDL